MIPAEIILQMRASAHRLPLPMILAVIGLCLAGCASVSTYHDPFDAALAPAAQSAIGPAAAGPSLRVVLAGSTAASMKDLADWSNLGATLLNPASMIDEVDPRHFQDDLNRVLAPGFRRIEYVYWNAPDSGSQTDYLLTLDIQVKLGRHSFGENQVDLIGVLSKPGGGARETLAGHGKSTIGFPAFHQHFTEARQAAFDEFARQLGASRLLAAYQETTPARGREQPTQVEIPSSHLAESAAAPPVVPQKTEARGGLYDLESKISFNVLDRAYYDAATGQLALIGHHDDRFKGPDIPYLQHLATLLECPKPEFSLAWTPDSSRRVDALFARELSQQESDAQAERLGAMVDSSGLITHTGALMLPALGIYPVNENRPPGELGVETQSINGGRVVVMKIVPGSAAEKAGLRQLDFIVSVRPDRPVFFPSELQRQVRFAGAGAEVEITYQRQNELFTTRATLDAAADPDPWQGVNRYDLIGLLYRAAGDPDPANVIYAMGIMNTMAVEKEQKAGLQAYTALMHALGMDADFQHLQEVGANSAPPYADSYNFGLKLSQQLDSVFHFDGRPLQDFFAAAVRQGSDPGSAAGQVMNEFDRYLKPKVGELIDRLIFRPGVGFQIPPELVEEEYHIHPEMTPEYLGVPRDSQLARLMLASDYLGKQLSNRQDLKRKIPDYQTQIEYQINHPVVGHRSNTAYRVWISVAGIDAAQSADSRTLALRDARMRFNIRETDSRENDLPNQQPGGYEDVLTGLYDQFETEFPELHELREAAKLAAVAVWMQQQDPGVRLPAEGRASWQGPEKVDGLVYIYLTANQRHESKIIKIAEGGVSLVPFPAGNRAVRFPTDAAVVDLRGTALLVPPPDSQIVTTAKPGASGPSFTSGWAAQTTVDGKTQDAVVLSGRSAFGTKIARPDLGPPVTPAVVEPGPNTKAADQLLSAAATAGSNGDLTKNYDGGNAAYAGSVKFGSGDPAGFTEREKEDPRMVAALQRLGALQARREELNAERDQLTLARNSEKDQRKMQALTEKLGQKDQEYQHNLTELAEQKEVVAKTKRIIDDTVETPPPQPAPPKKP